MKSILSISAFFILFSAFSFQLSALPTPGTITRDSNGKTYTTQPFGKGTLTRSSTGKTWTTQPYAKGTITRDSNGRTFTTQPFGKQSTPATAKGQGTSKK